MNVLEVFPIVKSKRMCNLAEQINFQVSEVVERVWKSRESTSP